MARYIYANPDPSTQSRATLLGCGWFPAVPAEFASIATAPCIVLSGAGAAVVLAESSTASQVATAAQPIVDAEAAQAAAQAAQVANGATIQSRAQAGLTANTAFLALGAPTNAQVLAQTQLLTKECNGLIRLALNLLDSTAGT